MGANNQTDARANAKAAGAIHYETGLACVHGHVAPRWTTSGRCTVCQGVFQRSDGGRARDRAKYLRNAEAVKARAAQWAKDHPERAAAASVASNSNSRARIIGVSGRITMGDVLDVLSAGRCFVCEATDRLTVDHVVCMTNGGENTRPNLQCLCLNCNSQKHRSSMEEFLAKKRAA